MSGWVVTAGLVLAVAMVASRGGPFGAAGWLVALPLRLGAWALGKVWAGTKLGVLSFLALVGEEVQRWLILATWGAVLLGFSYAGRAVHAPLTLQGVVAVATLVWLTLLVRNLRRVLAGRFARSANRALFRKLEEMADALPGQVEAAVAAGRQGAAQALPAVRPSPHPTERFTARIRQKAAEAVAGTTGEGGLAFEPVVAAPEVPRWMRRAAGQTRQGFRQGLGRKRGRS
ncbi:MAG TPA: hypothetical protein VG276_28750 [Actinomycetes bacterium]|jgi:hypothetical protein|nr:hypothetical protein [Actinomycetes bacterium]